MSEPLRYPVPWDVVAGLAPHIAHGTRCDVAALYRSIASRIAPSPVFKHLENLPRGPRFVLAANHYERKGLWIAHVASVLAAFLADRYQTNPPIRWLVTANWPRWRFGPLSIRSPGDVLLPRVARALWCYDVPFPGTDPVATARSLRRMRRDAAHLVCPIGIFPAGAREQAGTILPALDGTGRLLRILGWPVLPAGITEAGRFIVNFGPTISPSELRDSPEPEALLTARIAECLDPR